VASVRICTEELLNVEVSDTTGADSNSIAGYKISLIYCLH